LADKLTMNQRREPRFAVDQLIYVTLLREPESRLPATVKNSSGRGMGLAMATPVPIGTAVKIECDDAILLGEALYCRDDGGTFFVGVELEHALYGLVELGRILREFAEESSGLEYAQPVNNRRDQNQEQPH
jgi:hypothetical protein